MNQVKNLSRYWVDKDSNIIVRKWTPEEYMRLSPRQHIFEKYWSSRCPLCCFIPTPWSTKEEAEHEANTHRRIGRRHKSIVEYRDHELVCWELKYEYSKDFDIWVPKQKLYD